MKMGANLGFGTEECTEPLPSKNPSSRKNWLRSKLSICKVPILLLLWTFCTGLLYNYFLKPFSFLPSYDAYASVLLAVLISAVFLLSPLGGFIADVKFGRLKVLLCGTFMMLLPVCLIVITGIGLISSNYSFNSTGNLIFGATYSSLFLYCFGEILFLSNIVQFGTDQLRDAPTRYSVYFICAYYWTDSFGQLLTAATNIPGHEIVFCKLRNTITIDRLKGCLIGSVLGLSIALTCIVICVIYKRKSKWFIFEKCQQNPYTLVFKVVSYAIKHKKPIRRSAFTYCDNE